MRIIAACTETNVICGFGRCRVRSRGKIWQLPCLCAVPWIGRPLDASIRLSNLYQAGRAVVIPHINNRALHAYITHHTIRKFVPVEWGD